MKGKKRVDGGRVKETKACDQCSAARYKSKQLVSMILKINKSLHTSPHSFCVCLCSSRRQVLTNESAACRRSDRQKRNTATHWNLYYRCAHIFSLTKEDSFRTFTDKHESGHSYVQINKHTFSFVQHFMKPLEKFLQEQDIESIFINIEVQGEIIHTPGHVYRFTFTY